MLFVHIGSRNPQKSMAVMQAFRKIVSRTPNYLHHEVATSVPEQPQSLNEIVMGARTRAEGAIADCRPSHDTILGIGLESGLVMPMTHRDICFTQTCCAIYRPSRLSLPIRGGRITEWAYGLSSGFTVPDPILRHVKGGLDLSQATRAAGWTTHPKIGEDDGLISLLSEGRVTRRDQLHEAVRNALFHLDTLL